MWKTLGGFTAQISRFQHILPRSTAQINCSGSDLPFFRKPYLGGYCFRFNRRFALAEMTARIANAVCCCMPCTERALRVAEAYG
jgi:hypothetical protein